MILIQRIIFLLIFFSKALITKLHTLKRQKKPYKTVLLHAFLANENSNYMYGNYFLENVYFKDFKIHF